MAEAILAKMDPKNRAKIEQAFMAMSSIKPHDILQDFCPFLVVYKDGKIQRFLGTDTVPSGTDPLTGVHSKDVVVSPETGVFVRIYKPPNLNPTQKLPLLVYFHGGAFCIETASSPVYHLHLNDLCSQANVIIISVNYRLAPENPLPVGYEDSWVAVDWVAKGEDQWLREHGDYSRVFFGGDSAGANIAHHMAKRVGKNEFFGLGLTGVVLIHPFFWGEDRIGSEEIKIKTGSGTGSASKMWKFVCPGSVGSDDPLINPAKDPELVHLRGQKVLVLVAERDALRDRGFHYKEALVECGWKGVVEVVEAVGEDHVFHLMNPASASSAELMSRVVGFLNSNPTSEGEWSGVERNKCGL